MELRNTPLAGGKSPAEIVYGRPLRTRVPTHWTAFKPEWLKSMAEFDRKTAELAAKRAENYDKSAKTLPPLERGTEVLIQDLQSKRWDKAGMIVGIGKSRDYKIKTTCGRVTWRNRRFLRPLRKGATPEREEMDMMLHDEEKSVKHQHHQARPRPAADVFLGADSQEEPKPKRSKRVRFKTDRYQAEAPSSKKRGY